MLGSGFTSWVDRPCTMLGAGPVKKVRERTKDMERRTEMSRFLALIMLSSMALFIVAPAMAQPVWDVSKRYTYDKTSTVDKSTDITVTKEVDISVDGNLDATGGIEVQGDVVFKEMDVEVQDEEVVNKFFELDDSATSRWLIEGSGAMSVDEQLQNGVENLATINQLTTPPDNAMHVGLQYQVGAGNGATITQFSLADTLVNNFAKQIQIGDGNSATVLQN